MFTEHISGKYLNEVIVSWDINFVNDPKIIAIDK